jgi:hypothetical protein
MILSFCSNLDNNQFNGTLNIDHIQNLQRKLNHIYTGHLQTLSIRSNNISGVNISNSDIENVISIIK